MYELVAKQRTFFSSGETKSAEFRLAQLCILQKAIKTNESKILEALQLDLGKSKFDSYSTEIGLILNEINFFKKNLKRYLRPVRVKTPLFYFGAKSFLHYEPLGVSLVISPWNYPFILSMQPLIGAIAAGNCTVVKPSEYSPHVAGVIDDILSAAFSPAYIAVVQGGAEVSTELLKQRFDHIFYTGSGKVGRIVMRAAAENLTPVTLELGGKSPCIVDATVPLLTAARRIVWGKFINAGQTCVAPDYLLVQKGIKDNMLAALEQSIHEFYGDSLENYAKIINERHFDRLAALLEGRDLLYGGKMDRSRLSISPTLVQVLSGDDSLMQEEIFGPILPILEYNTIDEAIQFVNSRPKPLALYFFSNNRADIRRILRETSSGGVCINDTVCHITTESLPFGGVGDSGMGSYHGKASFVTFSHRKSVFRNQALLDNPLRYPPYRMSYPMLKKLFKFL